MKRHIKHFQAMLGEENVYSDSFHLSVYGFDSSKSERIPSCVLFPRDERDVVEIVRYANVYALPITARGAGSGMSGGCVNGGIILAMQKHFSKVLQIDQENLCVTLQPGVINARLNQILKPFNLFFPPDPASSGFSTIGGNIAENAGGMNAVKYGVSKNHLLSMRVVLGSGELIEVGHRTYKDVAGYDLLGLMCGSEGTLGVMTELTLKLSVIPKCSTSILLCFKDVQALAHASCSILANGVIPSAMEFLDSWSVRALNQKHQIYPKEAQAVLIIKLTSNSMGAIQEEVEQIKQVVQKFSPLLFWEAKDAEDEEKIWFGRKNASQANSIYGTKKLNEDITIPRSKVAVFLKNVEEVSTRYGFIIPCFGHIGDGNIHTNVMLADIEDLDRGHEAVKELFEIALSLGGTLSGEHGIGITKSLFMPLAFPPYHLRLFEAIKKVFDPNNILNPNKMGLRV